MAYIPSLLERVRDCGPRLDFLVVMPLLLALVDIIPSVFNIIIEVSCKNPREWRGGVVRSRKLSKAEKGRNTSATQPQIEQGLPPAASDLCFCLLVGWVLSSATSLLPCGLEYGCKKLVAWHFPCFTIKELKSRHSFPSNWRKLRKSWRKNMIGPSDVIFHLGQSWWPKKQDCWGRRHFPVKCNHGEEGHVLQQGGCKTQQKQRRWTVSQTVNISLKCSLSLLADSISFPGITSSTLETFPRLSWSK